MELTTCPECGHDAEVLARDVMESSSGPVEHVKTQCILRHIFFMPTAKLESPRTV